MEEESRMLMGIQSMESEELRKSTTTALGTRKIVRCNRNGSMEEDDFINLLHGSDPVKIELNRLENELREKSRELAEAQNEIKALKLTERAKAKALSEVTEELDKAIAKYQASEASLEDKNLEIKRITEEKKETLAAQYAAEATLRRVHAAQKDEEMPPVESILLPLEAELKILRQEVATLQDDNRAMERLSKTKEAALLEAERDIHLAKVKAALVDELLNRNQELVKQNDICQEEYKILDRMHRQKVAEVEKMGQTIKELQEALLSGAATANAVRDYQRQVNELKGEKKTLERTLSRIKVTENRAAVMIANEWKDENEKMIPVRQWLEERRVLMGEMQQLRDKLSIAERAAKAEAQLKEKFQTRLKIIEDCLRSSNMHITNGNGNQNDSYSSPSTNGSLMKKASPPIGRSSSLSRYAATTPKFVKGASRSFDGRTFSDDNEKNELLNNELIVDNSVNMGKEHVSGAGDDFVSIVLYDLLQKEVISLRKGSLEKDQGLKDKESHIETLSRKVDTLTKALEIEAKKMQREKAAMVKEVAAIRAEKENELKTRRSKGTALHNPSK